MNTKEWQITRRANEPADPISESDRVMWRGIWQALLMMVDVIERRIGINPRTAELRKEKR